MSVRELTYEEACNLLNLTNGSGTSARLEAAWAEWGQTATTEDVISVLQAQGWKDIGPAKVTVMEPASGGINGYVGTMPVSYADPIDSNALVRSNVRVPINTTAEVVGERSVMTAKVGLREAGTFAIGEVVPAVIATGVGISLGKTIDSTLYNLNPDFWNSHNMSSLDPETWNRITTDYDGTAGRLFDLVFGLDGDKTQAYIDEDALAYIAKYLDDAGAFDPVTYAVDPTTVEGLSDPSNVPNPLNIGTGILIDNHDPSYPDSFTANPDVEHAAVQRQGNYSAQLIYASKSNFSVRWVRTHGSSTIFDNTLTPYTATYYGETCKVLNHGTNAKVGQSLIGAGQNTQLVPRSPVMDDIAKVILFGTRHKTSGVTGIDDQTGATLPTTTGWNDIPSTKQSLQQQYPDLWTNAKHQDYVDENGQNRTKTLIPINLPNATNPFDTQPTSGDRTQGDPLIDPETASDTLLDTITDLITTIIDMLPDTGSGDSPVVPAPTGRASSLWKIYNPTQAQVDAFGAWLWDSSFVEQIKKLFNDPMQAIIGIHKVFASPSIGGTATIKVGYLDSEVPSDWVDNQYTTINCGTVNLSEYFGNVFDYSPYTRVSLYLPFIGIVDLDNADVMRASITVKYHVDVLSGACLADVIVNRDASGGVLYQYSGSAIVTYPVSSGNYMGMVAGVLSIAGGIAGTIMSGGALAPALIGGAVGASHLHTDVSHSGSFSGCAGAMAGKKPYIIVSRPQTAMAGNYGHFTGKPANSDVILTNCSGYTKVKSVYVGRIASATNEEKDMIEAQLKAGVLI